MRGFFGLLKKQKQRISIHPLGGEKKSMGRVASQSFLIF
jgi:hypothetical protein